MRRVGLFLLTTVFLTACLTPKPILTSRPTPGARVVPNIPLQQWGDNTCGAGALSTVLRSFGDPVAEEELARALPRGRHDGIVSIDLLLAARNRGYAAELVRGTHDLVERSVREGIPVILMLNVADLPGEKSDRFHYIVVDGFDAAKKIYRTQFGDGRPRWLRLDRLERPWSRAGYATLIVRGKDPRIDGDSTSRLRRAVALEDLGKVAEALAIYEALLAIEESALLWTNIGNAHARLGRHADAELAYRRALANDPEYRDALNNLAWLLLQQKKNLGEAESLARQAATLSGPDTHLYERTFAQLLAARGKCAEAREVHARLAASGQPGVDSTIRCGK